MSGKARVFWIVGLHSYWHDYIVEQVEEILGEEDGALLGEGVGGLAVEIIGI